MECYLEVQEEFPQISSNGRAKLDRMATHEDTAVILKPSENSMRAEF